MMKRYFPNWLKNERVEFWLETIAAFAFLAALLFQISGLPE